MSQISPPIRILLVCAVAFMASWMLFLRPSTETGAPAADAPIPAATAKPVEAGGPDADSVAGKLVEKANEATAKQDAQAEAIAGGSTEAPAATVPATGTQPAPTATAGEPGNVGKKTGGLPLRVLKAIGERKVVVLLFWNPKAADDKGVERALTGIDRHKGKVLAHAAHIKRIAAYQQITRGAQVEQSPTIVVIDRDRKVQTAVGYVDRTSIDQMVADALRKQK